MLINRIVKNNSHIHDIHSAVAVRCPSCHKGRLMDAAGIAKPFALQLFCSDTAERADRPTLFIKCPKCGKRIGLAIDRPKPLVH